MYHFSYWITTKGVCFLLDMLTWMVIANKALLICLANKILPKVIPIQYQQPF